MPTVERTMPRPTATGNPVAQPDNRPTSSTTPRDNDDTAAAGAEDNAADVTMRAESVSSGTSLSVTVSSETMVNIEQLIWNTLVSNECAPRVRYLLDDADFYPINNMTSTDKLKAFATIGNTRPIERDSFIRSNTFGGHG
eukprot:6492683-Amphidinium_carterae.2